MLSKLYGKGNRVWFDSFICKVIKTKKHIFFLLKFFRNYKKIMTIKELVHVTFDETNHNFIVKVDIFVCASFLRRIFL